MIFVGPATSSYRVTVLLNLLGRLKEVHLDIDILEKVSSSPSREWEQSTEGKVLKIKRPA